MPAVQIEHDDRTGTTKGSPPSGLVCSGAEQVRKKQPHPRQPADAKQVPPMNARGEVEVFTSRAAIGEVGHEPLPVYVSSYYPPRMLVNQAAGLRGGREKFQKSVRKPSAIR